MDISFVFAKKRFPCIFKPVLWLALQPPRALPPHGSAHYRSIHLSIYIDLSIHIYVYIPVLWLALQPPFAPSPHHGARAHPLPPPRSPSPPLLGPLVQRAAPLPRPGPQPDSWVRVRVDLGLEKKKMKDVQNKKKKRGTLKV